jgi:hypothetical protein
VPQRVRVPGRNPCLAAVIAEHPAQPLSAQQGGQGDDGRGDRVPELHTAGHSIDEIAAALPAARRPLNRTGIAEVIAAEGLPRLWRRPDTERSGVRREIQARAQALDFGELPARAETRLPGCWPSRT